MARTRPQATGSKPPMKRQRVSLACDRCRVKKRKCSGETPCRHCITDGMLCSRNRRRKVGWSPAASPQSIEFYEDQLQQLSKAVSKLYARLRDCRRSADVGPSIAGWPEKPDVHTIIMGLGLGFIQEMEKGDQEKREQELEGTDTCTPSPAYPIPASSPSEVNIGSAPGSPWNPEDCNLLARHTGVWPTQEYIFCDDMNSTSNVSGYNDGSMPMASTMVAPQTTTEIGYPGYDNRQMEQLGIGYPPTNWNL